MRVSSVVLIVVWAAWVSLAAETRHLELSVSPTVSFEPAHVRVRVTLDPKEEQRYMVVEAASEGFYRRSDFQLSGDAAARTRWVEWRALSEGEYVIVVQVFGATGTVVATARATFVVQGHGFG